LWWHAAATPKVTAAFNYSVRFTLTQNEVLAAESYRPSTTSGTPRFNVSEKHCSLDKWQGMVMLRMARLLHATG
jgi:hypothetical protein